MKSIKLFISIIALLTSIGSLKAQDRHFVWTYESTVLTKGHKDLEFWTTWRYGKNQFYSALDNRLEFETGLTKWLQTAFYFNTSYVNQLVNTAAFGFPIHELQTSSEFSISNEWKAKFSDPVANTLGSGAYFEYLISPNGYELEGKIILDKRFGKNLLAFNGVTELEYENDVEDQLSGEVETEHEETELEADLSYMHLFKENFGLGIESRYQNGIEVDEDHDAIYAGPSLFWGTEGCFIIFNIMPQIQSFTTTGPTERRDLDDHEKIAARILIGFDF